MKPPEPVLAALSWPQTLNGPRTLGGWTQWRVGAVVLAFAMVVLDYAQERKWRPRRFIVDIGPIHRIDLAFGVIVISLVALVVAVLNAKDNQGWRDRVLHGPQTALLALPVLGLLTAPLSNAPWTATQASRWLLAYWLALFAIVALIHSERREMRGETSLVVLAVLGLGLVFRLAVWSVRVRVYLEVPEVLEPPFVTQVPYFFRIDRLNGNTVGPIAAFASVVALHRSRVSFSTNHVVALAWGAVGAWMFWVCLLSNSRVALGVLVAAFGVAALQFMRNTGVSVPILAALAVVCVLAFQFMFATHVRAFLGPRSDIWKSALLAWMDSPFIGHGFGGNEKAALKVRMRTNHSHNAVLSALVTLGPIGFVLAVTALGQIARRVWEQRSQFLGTPMVFLAVLTIFCANFYSGFLMPHLTMRNLLVALLVVYVSAGGWPNRDGAEEKTRGADGTLLSIDEMAPESLAPEPFVPAIFSDFDD